MRTPGASNHIGRLVLASTGLHLGGTETQVANLAFALKERRWWVTVMSLLGDGHFTPILEGRGIPVDSLGMLRGRASPRGFQLALRTLQARRPHALLCFGFHANMLGRLVGRVARVPVVVSSVRNENFGPHHRYLIMRFTDWLADATVTNSQIVAEQLLRRKVAAPAKLRVIPNSYTATNVGRGDRGPDQLRGSLGVGEHDFMWLAVGRAEAQKDYPTLVAAFARVATTEPRSVLCIAGRDPDQLLAPLVTAWGIAHRCRLLGVRGDIPTLLEACDGFVLASAWEGLPNSVMEAAGAAKPIVATRVGGVPEIVEHGASGLLVEPGQPEELAAAMIELMRCTPRVRAAMGRRGRAAVLRKCDPARVTHQWEELIMSLLRGKLREST